MKLNKQNYLILGLARSGLAGLNLIYNKHSQFFLYDQNAATRMRVYEKTKLKPNVFILQNLSNKIIDQVDVLIVSPSFELDNKYIAYAKKQNKTILGELELGFQNCHNKFYAITGTNGKTTTTRLLGNMFKCSNKKVSVVGNIGVPVCSIINNKTKQHAFVCETSSFQLETINKFKPKVAAILNIGVDHIDHHKTLKKYIQAKYDIAKNMTKRDCLVLNNNCAPSKKLANKVNCKVYYFDTDKECVGCFVKEQKIYFNTGKKLIYITKTSNIRLLGKHNLENVLCAVAMAYLSKIKPKHIESAIKSFFALPHRLQLVASHNQVEYINDSKATNPDATLTAIKAIDKEILLILGGSDKGYDYDQMLIDLTNKVKQVVCYGQVSQKILLAANRVGLKNITAYDTLYDATKYCFDNVAPNQCVLLSPAAASFDQFENYVDRGLSFEKYVKEFISENQ